MKDMTKEWNYDTAFTEEEKYQLKLLEAAAIIADLNMDTYAIDGTKDKDVCIWWDDDGISLSLDAGMMHIYKIMVHALDAEKKTTYFDLQTRLPKDVTRWVDRVVEESKEED